MKRILISFAAALVMLPALAQPPASTVKIDPKNNKVGRPVVDKPKVKLMTRDELRACFDLNDVNFKEAEGIKVAQASYKENSAALLKEKAELQKADDDNVAASDAAKKERTGILAMFEEIKAAAPKMEKAELDAKNKEYQARAAAFDVTVSSVNEAAKSLAARRKAFGEKVDALNASFKVLEERTEAHFDKSDAWKNDCSKKSYDEADELAIKKERAAAGK